MDALTTCCSNRPGKGMSINPFGRNPDDPSIPANKNFITVGRGFGGVDELAASLDESKVMWGLIAQSVGSGSMARTKYVFLYFSGSKCPMVRRMRYTEKRPAAVEALGGGGMIDWDRENQADVHLDSLLEKVLASVVADDANANMSVASLKAGALEQIKKASEQVQRIAPTRKKKWRRPGAGRTSAVGGLVDGLRRLSNAMTGGGGGPPTRTALALRPDFKLSQALEMVKSSTGASCARRLCSSPSKQHTAKQQQQHTALTISSLLFFLLLQAR